MKPVYAVAAMLTLAGAASAQATVQSVTLQDLERFATDAGHEVVAFGETTENSLRAETPNGVTYYMEGTACDDGACRGIIMSSRFQATDAVTLDKVNRANLERAAVSVWRLEDSVGVSRYVILDGGMSEANIKINLDNFLAIVPGVVEYFFEQ
ncbi:YbjN domain-containing protein [Thalassovita mediterranea]|nr:YbjN domain-containing protein [Thalassovita mediterranea]